MSDISIPGVTNKYNTDKIIKGLVNVEKLPLKRMEKNRDILKKQKSVWRDLNRKLSTLRDSAKELFGFQNPFKEKIAKSSDNNVLKATATRKALEENKKILVKRIAAADRFISESLPKDFKVPAGKYGFKVGEKSINFTFKGGSLKDFAEILNRKSRNLVKAQIISDTPGTRIIAVESQKTGRKKKLLFLDKAVDFGLKSGILKRTGVTERDIPLTKYSVTSWKSALKSDSYSISDGTLTVNPAGELKIPVTPSFNLNKNMVLQFQLKTEIIPEKKSEETKPPPGPSLPDTGEINFKGIKVKNEKSRVILPQWKPPVPAKRIDDMQVLFFNSNGKIHPLNKIEDSKDFKSYEADIGAISNTIDSINIKNRNTNRIIVVKNIKIFDKTSRGKYIPSHPISEAGDAELIMDGIKIKRDSNNIDDLLPGVNITLLSKSDKPVTIKVEKDKEAIKNSIVALVGHYNQVITEIDVVSRRDKSVIEDAKYLTDEERNAYRKKLGIFAGSLTMYQLKDSLQRVMMNPYRTDGGRNMSLLAQIGISTDTRKPGEVASVDKTRLRGYLEIDEARLDDQIAAHAGWIKELFGNDTDGDLIIDSGAAYSLDRLLNPYVTIGGIIAAHLTTLDGQISRKNRDINNYEDHLKKYEADLKYKYGKMEGALQALEKNSKALENLGGSNNRR
ncbi:MAG: flagellar filament capping protein FliD [Spirochaetes bacterium]|nr:flagellar filament capping protein FliD [Spirochaetota bacterium]